MRVKKRYLVQINESPYSNKGKFVVVKNKPKDFRFAGVLHKHVKDKFDDWHVGNKGMFRPLTKREEVELALEEGY
jgi:hypothetical protein